MRTTSLFGSCFPAQRAPGRRKEFGISSCVSQLVIFRTNTTPGVNSRNAVGRGCIRPTFIIPSGQISRLFSNFSSFARFVFTLAPSRQPFLHSPPHTTSNSFTMAPKKADKKPAEKKPKVAGDKKKKSAKKVETYKICECPTTA